MLPSRSGVLVEAVSMYEISDWTDNSDFKDQICLKMCFQSKIEKVNSSIGFCIFELVYVLISA